MNVDRTTVKLDDDDDDQPKSQTSDHYEFYDRLTAMHRISRAIGSELDLDAILFEVVEELSSILKASHATLFLVDTETNELWSKVLLEGNDLKEIRLSLGDGIAGYVAATGRPLNIQDAYNDPRFDSRYDEVSGIKTRTVMCCPVQTGNDQIVGVIEVINKEKGCFTLADMIVVETIQPSLGIAIENAVLYQSLLSQNKTLERTRDALQARMRELDLLYTLEKVIASQHDNNDELICEMLRESAVSIGSGVIMCVLADGPTARAYVADCRDDPVFTTLQTKPVGKLLEVLQHGKAWSAETVETMLGDGLDGYIFDDALIVLAAFPEAAFSENSGKSGALVALTPRQHSALEPEAYEKMMSLIASQIARGLNIAEAN
jgi:putative methionine-R-sulfoxide reductase with GAF domain